MEKPSFLSNILKEEILAGIKFRGPYFVIFLLHLQSHPRIVSTFHTSVEINFMDKRSYYSWSPLPSLAVLDCPYRP